MRTTQDSFVMRRDQRKETKPLVKLALYRSLSDTTHAMPTSPPSEKKKLILNAFVHQTPAHLNPGLFKYPADQSQRYKDLKYWITLAQKLEAANFHCIFFADVLAGYDVYKNSLAPSIEAGSQCVYKMSVA